MLKVVLDTNILFAASLHPERLPSRIVELVISGKITSHFSAEIRSEMEETLSEIGTQDILVPYFARSLLTIPTEHIHLCRDPDDDKFIECAVAAGASFIITGDGALRELGSVRGISIVSPAEFLRRYE